MRNVLSATALVMLGAAPACAQAQVVVQPAPAVVPAMPWAQKLVYGVTSHDFGTVPYGAQLKHHFKVKNIYAVPLQITDIKTSCGCLSFTSSHFSPGQPGKVLQPQEEGWVDINMDGRRFKGPKQITLQITVGPRFVSTAVIVVTANARTDVVFNPGEVDFGIVRLGQAVTSTMDVEYAGSLDWRILDVVKNTDAPFKVETREMYRKGARFIRQTNTVGYQLAVTLKADAPVGPFRQELMLRTNDPSSPILTVVVEGNVQATLSVAPDKIALGAVKIGSPKTQRVQVRGNRPFRVLAVEGAGKEITADLPAAAATSHFLTLHCRPEQAGPWRKQVTIRTDLDGGASAVVTIEGNVEP